MKARDLIVIGAVLLIAALAYAAGALRGAPPAFAVIRVGNEVYRSVPLDEYGSVTIDQGDGRINVVTIGPEGVFMESSSCKNQLCVRQGVVNLQNAEELALGRWIICLPNGVSVELAEGGE